MLTEKTKMQEEYIAELSSYKQQHDIMEERLMCAQHQAQTASLEFKVCAQLCVTLRSHCCSHTLYVFW